MGCHEECDGCVVLPGDDAIFVDEDALEDGLVDLSSLGLVCLLVDGVAVRGEVNCSCDGVVDAGGLLFGGGEACSCCLDLFADSGLFGFEVNRPGSGGGSDP